MQEKLTHVVTTTIGRDWLIEKLQEIEDTVEGHIGQTQHYLSLCRTRDAMQHMRLTIAILEARHADLIAEIFAP